MTYVIWQDDDALRARYNFGDVFRGDGDGLTKDAYTDWCRV